MPGASDTQAGRATGATRTGPVEESQGRGSRHSSDVIETTIAQAATFAALIAGGVGLLYVIGGTVLWLRFEKAGLPADRAVALVPKADLLVLGLRVMVLPALASAALLLILGSAWRSRQTRLRRLRAEKARHVSRMREDDGEHADLRERVDELDEKIRRTEASAADQLPDPRSRPLRFALLAAFAVLVALLVPFSAGALAWPIALVALLWYWLRLIAQGRLGGDGALPFWRLAIAAAVAASLITIARQTDPPVELVSFRAELEDPSDLLRNALGGTRTPRDDDELVTISGVLVAITGDTVHVGNAEKRIIASIPRRGVASMTIGPPLDQRAPPRSLLSRLVSGDAWAVTPLELWCGNVKYDWGEIGDACQADPDLAVDDVLRISDDHVRGVRVRCPQEASEGCRGFVTLITDSAGTSTTDETVLPVRIQSRGFAFAGGREDQVPIVVGESELWRQLSGEEHDDVPLRVDVTVVVSFDAERRAVVGRVTSRLVVSPPEEEEKKKKDRDAGTPPSGGDDNDGQSDADADAGEQPGEEDGDDGADQEDAPEPETTPEATDPLPPQDETLAAPTPP